MFALSQSRVINTYMLPEYEGQNGRRQLCQEYDENEQEELRKAKLHNQNINSINYSVWNFKMNNGQQHTFHLFF